jgi:hypothetical protein
VFLRLFLFAALTLGLQAQDKWIAQKSGPFEIFTTGNERAAREKLVYLEQFRETLRVITGKQEMHLVWPIQVVLYKTAQQLPAASPHFALSRESRMLTIPEAGALSRDTIKELGRILVVENTAGLPKPVEDALINLVSTIQVDGPRITIGAPPPQAERTHEWALLQFVTTTPEYIGRAHILVSNMEQSGDFDAACRNAFDKSAQQMNQQVDAYLKTGNFATGMISGRAMGVRDGKVEVMDRQDVAMMMADLLLATGSPKAGAAYEAVSGIRSAEGQGLAALNDGKRNEAREFFEHAVGGESRNARAWLEAGNLEADKAIALVDFKRAASLNPRWGEPYIQMADLEFDPEKRAAQLKKAAALDTHNIELWQTLARAETAAKNFPEAQKAWGGAERAAANEEERAKIHQVRLQLDEQQIVVEKADRKRAADEKQEELDRLKAQSDAAIHAAEQAAHNRLNADGAAAPKNPVWLDELKANASVDGAFLRLECLGTPARMVIKTADGKTVQLMIRDPNAVTLLGSAEKTMGCGTQSGSPRVHVEYEGKPDAKMRTTGDVTSIEFR